MELTLLTINYFSGNISLIYTTSNSSTFQSNCDQSKCEWTHPWRRLCDIEMQHRNLYSATRAVCLV